jgi:transcriptional regulator with XRE-family HTH domain
MTSDELSAYLLTLGARVRTQRERLGMSIEELAQKSGVGVQTLYRVESGHPGLAVQNLLKVLSALNVPAPEILEDNARTDLTPVYATHDYSAPVSNALDEAARAASDLLDGLFARIAPGRQHVSVAFTSQLREHLRAMLTGCHSGVVLNAEPLDKLIYSARDVGANAEAAEDKDAVGFAPRIMRTARVLATTSSAFEPLHRIKGSFASTRHAAATLCLDWLAARTEAVQSNIRIVPIYRDKDARYTFVHPLSLPTKGE